MIEHPTRNVLRNESDEPTDLDKGNTTFRDEPTDVSLGDAKTNGNSPAVEERNNNRSCMSRVNYFGDVRTHASDGISHLPS